MTTIVAEVLSLLLHILLQPLDAVLAVFTAAGELHNLTGEPWVRNMIAGSQALAGAVLAARTGWEAFQLATLRTEGTPTDPGALLKRVVVTALAIVAGPPLAVQALDAGNLLAQAVSGAGLGPGLPALGGNLQALAAQVTATELWEPLLVLGGIVLVLLCFLQAMVRTIEMTLAAILAPVMALGFLSGGGTADIWLREVIVLATSQAVELLLLDLAAALLVAPSVPGGPSGLLDPFLFLAACWVAWRTPRLLRQYGYQTAGQAAGGAAMTAARVLTKLPL